jgi:hypothetical protein
MERLLRAMAAEPSGIHPPGPDGFCTLSREKCAIVKHMVENSHDVEDIEKVLRAYRPPVANGVAPEFVMPRV